MTVSWTRDTSPDPMPGSARGQLRSSCPGTAVVTSRASIEDRFASLYQAEFVYVWKSARRLGVNRAEADDVVQETFLVVHRLFDTYDPNRSARSWLFAVLLRVVQRHRRSHRRRTVRTDHDANIDTIPESAARSPDRSAETTETVRLLEEILDGLDPDKRAVLVLAELEEKPISEIAEILGINERTATSRLHRAREHLDASLARHRARDGWRSNVTTDPDKKRSALVPLAALYAPEDGDATRVLEKLRASIDAEAAAHSARAAGRGSRRGLAKLAGLSCIALALVGGMIVRERGAERTSPPATAEAPPTVVATAHSAAANDEPTTAAGPAQDDSPSLPAIPSVPVGALPSVPPPAVTTVPRPSPSSSASPTITPTDTLEREARLLAEARHALAVGESERALTLLDEHARTFPNGLLAGDRAAERIVVLCGLGRDEAAGEAKSFLDGHPKSPHARRIAASCAGQP